MKRGCSLFILCIVLCFTQVYCGKRETNIIRIKGSTTLEPVIIKAKEIFLKKHNITFEIASNGSHRGIEELINGSCDIAESSVQISSHEKELAKKNGVIIHEYIIARDLIVPIVHKTNPLNSISLRDLQGIYAGSKTSWKLFGWDKEPIIIIGRDRDSGTGDVWNNSVMGNAGLSDSIVIKRSNSSVLSHVAEDPAAIGYISHGFTNSEIKELMVDGTKAEIPQKGPIRYPLIRNLYLYTNDTNKKPEVKSFIVFLLSNEGQKLINEMGFVPLGYKE